MEATNDLWTHALTAVRRGLPATLVVVADCSGSVPGKTTAKLVVSELGCSGTVGGGIAESRLIEQAKAHHGGAELVSFRHTPETGSLCAGIQTFAMLALEERHAPVLESIVATLEGGGHGTLRLSNAAFSFTAGQQGPQSFSSSAAAWRYEETLGRLDTLYIVGGGHVSLALSRVMVTLPFRVVVMDNREELPSMRENSYAHEARVISYDRVAEQIPEGEQTWVVIMTWGHRDDESVLGQLAERSFRYLGMMGSEVKVRQIYANLERRGVSCEALQRVHSPIGVDIASHTPPEIAISIAAEIIRERNRALS